MNQQVAVIIDVRDPHEFGKEHIAGAISLPFVSCRLRNSLPGTRLFSTVALARDLARPPNA
jgi:rhodanese-related sulfurtransferase